MAKLNRVMSQDLSGNEAALEVDLSEMFGQEITDSSLRQQIGQAIIDKIRERTQDKNVSVTGSNFKDYSEEYAESIAFKAYGKSKSEPNLTQTGDMLGLMDIVDESQDKLVIGWNDSLQAAKAHGHITGHVGVKRNFLGLPIGDIEDIADQFKDELPKETEAVEGSIALSDLTERFLTRPTVAIEGVKTITGTRTFGDILKALAEED